MNSRLLTVLPALLLFACDSASPPPPPPDQPEAPSFVVLSPGPVAETHESSLEISGRVKADGGLAELTWQVDEGAPQALQIEPGTVDFPFSFALPLAEGEHLLHLRAVDGYGGVGTSEVRITRSPPPDTQAPEVQVLSPMEGQSITVRRVRLEGTATDALHLASLTWALNGSEPEALDVAALGTGGAFAFEVTPRPGANKVLLRATDASGNATEVTASFYYGSRSGAGGLHTGVVRDGFLYTWGRNNRGQLGLGASVTADQKLPLKVPDFEGVAAMAFNQNNSLALKADGTVWSWGENAQGQLGLGAPPDPEHPHTPDLTARWSPTLISSLSGVVAITVGYRHALVLMEDGTVRAFGDNSTGQLGDGSSASLADYPVAVSGLSDVVKVVAGSMHSVALRRDGTVWVWGRNSYGNLGGGTVDSTPHSTPTQVPGLTGVVDIATGRDHVLALHSDGTVSGWGLDASGQLGSGETFPDDQSASPLKVKGLADARAVFANGNMSYAQRADGSLISWGQNFNGQLGNGGKTDMNEPTPSVSGLTGLLTLAPGATHVISIRKDGAIFAWGWSSRGSLGRDDLLDNWSYPEPVQVTLP
ncbi:RCC1 domain-containing protein [Hyalangium versicolor]|uniref:RCC1 domain-containing protein n=1 Tax=Hyalangium versicolor TaxID=2861190 RepID=UPI001CD00A98|nr:chromosome condensation regulator RCC1 [Hyalangium versicolor]